VPALAAIVFPFRRLAIWLSVLVCGLAALAVAITALLVLPSLRDDLVSERLREIDRSAKVNVQLFLGTDPAEAVSVYERLTGHRAVVLQVLNDRGDLLQVAGSMTGAIDDPLAQEALAGNLVSRVVRTDERYAAEAVVPIRDADGDRFLLLFASPLNDVDRTVQTVQRGVVLAVAIALPVTWVVGLLAAYALSARIRRLERATRRIAHGNLAVSVTDEGRDEIHELAGAFDDMRRRLDRTDRARRDFIAHASHELRTPLFALGGFLELLEEETDPEAQREFVATMRGQVDRLTRLATDLLDLSRLDAGGVEVARDEVDMGTVAAQVAADFAATAEQRGVTVVCDEPGEAPFALADEGRVTQVVRALVDNAIRHNPPGTAVHVAVAETADGVTLTVADDGPPIDAALLERLFDRFVRGSAGGEGSGLGLAIARELAQRMGGSLTVEQPPEAAGKRFRLVLEASERPALTMLRE
jgi:signal transduction histidine kinase